ncbi:hypothetical protein PAPYR_177 [Paratrimastix pyriformis]|uniref:Uncharacterized protein n=1 Tax=Paratrimastix pyriformis TaxID=342808 RepID=A0ABQ8UVN8_9EUKA|nr:hypothetical protein PAPYR_177 [Paratrimastix pyriformis]
MNAIQRAYKPTKNQPVRMAPLRPSRCHYDPTALALTNAFRMTPVDPSHPELPLTKALVEGRFYGAPAVEPQFGTPSTPDFLRRNIKFTGMMSATSPRRLVETDSQRSPGTPLSPPSLRRPGSSYSRLSELSTRTLQTHRGAPTPPPFPRAARFADTYVSEARDEAASPLHRDWLRGEANFDREPQTLQRLCGALQGRKPVFDTFVGPTGPYRDGFDSSYPRTHKPCPPPPPKPKPNYRAFYEGKQMKRLTETSYPGMSIPHPLDPTAVGARPRPPTAPSALGRARARSVDRAPEMGAPLRIAIHPDRNWRGAR